MLRFPDAMIPFRLRPLATMIVGVFALACSGGGGSGGDGVGVSDTGSTSIFLTDAASDRFDEILVTLRSIELIGNGAPIEIFSGRETVDLKDLENYSDLFAYAEDVPVGTYSKIRLGVDAIALVEEDEIIDVDPPANGKIDLLPRGPFQIRKDITTVIEIDMDAKKSIHIVETGRGEVYRFRPVVFVSIEETRPPQKLARVHGEIVEIIDDMTFELCSTVFMAARTNSSEEDDVEGGIGDRHRCMRVELDEATGLFDSNGDPTTSDALRVEDEVTVVGAFHLLDANHDDMVEEERRTDGGVSAARSHHEHHGKVPEFVANLRSQRGDDSDDDTDKKNKKKKDKPDRDGDTDSDSDTDTDSDSDTDTDTDGGGGPVRPKPEIVFLAYVVEIGPPGTFLHLKGVIESEVDDVDEFDFAIAPGQGFGDMSLVTALLQDGTRIFSKRGVELDESEIIPDTDAKIDGVFASDEMGTFYKTALLVLDLEVDDTMVLRGSVISTNDENRRLLLDVDGASECVDVPEEAGIFLIHENEEGAISQEGDFDDLTPGLRSDVFGMFEQVGGCFVARTIIGFPIMCEESIECPVGQFCAREVATCDEAGSCQTAPEACPTVFEPVCGCDDVTYSNACEAAAAGASIASEGACEGGGIVCGGAEGLLCPDGDICVVPMGVCAEDAAGVCQKEPEECPDIVKPVCGCDGKTFANACEAAKAGVTVDSDGACGGVDVCGGVESLECGPGDVCLREVGSCDAMDDGLCVAAPEACPAISDPVCGCDGTTYDNGCLALQAGAGVESLGACEDVPGVCDAALCSNDSALMDSCETFLDRCLTELGVIDEQCDAAAALICEGGPPTDLDPANVCSQRDCANDSSLADQCETFLTACLANSLGERECLGGAFLICGEVGVPAN